MSIADADSRLFGLKDKLRGSVNRRVAYVSIHDRKGRGPEGRRPSWVAVGSYPLEGARIASLAVYLVAEVTGSIVDPITIIGSVQVVPLALVRVALWTSTFTILGSVQVVPVSNVQEF